MGIVALFGVYGRILEDLEDLIYTRANSMVQITIVNTKVIKENIK